MNKRLAVPSQEFWLDPVCQKDSATWPGTGVREVGGRLESRWGQCKAHSFSDSRNDRRIDFDQQLVRFLDRAPEGKFLIVVDGSQDSGGPAANLGRQGNPAISASIWSDFVGEMANFKINSFTHHERVFLAGSVSAEDIRDQYWATPGFSDSVVSDLRKGVELFDGRMAATLKMILASVGGHRRSGDACLVLTNGGHNLNFPFGKTMSGFLKRPYVEVQVDFHSDCRPVESVPGFHEGRHSGNHNTRLLSAGYIERAYFMLTDVKWNNLESMALLETDDRIDWQRFSYQEIGGDASAFKEATGAIVSDIFRRQPAAPVMVTICGDTIQPNGGFATSAGKSNKGLTPAEIRVFLKSLISSGLNVVGVQIAEFNKSLNCRPDDKASGQFLADLVGD
ncbi:MAG: arginase family enzyme, partial [Candidatus Marinamargulisbacteria bacterium]